MNIPARIALSVIAAVLLLSCSQPDSDNARDLFKPAVPAGLVANRLSSSMIELS